MTHPSPRNSRIEEATRTSQARKPGWWERLLLQEDLNFLLTNRVPRIALTRFMGWFSALRSPLLTRLSIAVWRLFTDLDLSEARTDRFNSLQECFTRELRPGARTVDPDPQVLTSPSDGIVGACGTVEQGQLYRASRTAWPSSSARIRMLQPLKAAPTSRCG
jgi:phosphatidylserine decarboxylase